MAETANPLSELELPPVRPPGQGAFPTRPRHLEAWLRDLPLANVGETAKQVYAGLGALNVLDLPPADRFKLMEAFRSVTAHVDESLGRAYVGQSFPLSERGRSIAALAGAFRDALATGYERVAAAHYAERGPRTPTRLFVPALHRAMEHLVHRLLIGYLAYTAPPPRTWRDLHRLYAAAEREGVHRRTAYAGSDGLADSVAGLYKQTLLLALAGPYHLHQSEVDPSFRAAAAWQAHCELVTAADPRAEHCPFAIDLRSDAQPAYQLLPASALGEGTEVRLLDTRGLKPVLEALMGDPSLPVVGGGTLSQDLLRRLALAWGTRAERKHPRSQRHKTVQVAVGLSAVHRWLAAPPKPAPSADPPAAAPPGSSGHGAGASAGGWHDPLSLLPEDLAVRGHRVFPGGRRSTYSGKADSTWQTLTPGPAAQQGPSPPRQPAPREALLLNEGIGGYQLRFAKKTLGGLEIGQLVCLARQGPGERSAWGLGVVRWMRCTESGFLEVGVQRLAHSPTPLKVRRRDGPGDWLDALGLPPLPAIDMPATLVVPSVLNEADAVLRIRKGDTESVARLGRRLECSLHFVRFECAPPERSDPANEFDGVWSLL